MRIALARAYGSGVYTYPSNVMAPHGRWRATRYGHVKHRLCLSMATAKPRLCACTEGGRPMEPPQTLPQTAQGLRRREVLQAGLMAGAALSTWSLSRPSVLWGADTGPPKRGGILRVRGYDPVHFDHHLTTNFKTNTTLSFVHSRLVRHKVGADMRPGTFIVEPDL